MDCQLFDAQWTDYLDRSLSSSERQAMDVHLSECAECRAQLTAIEQVDRRLRLECGAILQAIDESGEVPSPPIENFLLLLRDGSAIASPKGMPERMWRLRWVLALLCGTNTAANMISAARSYAGTPANTNPGDQKWRPFLRRLAYLTTEICGRAAGELIWVVGSNEI